MTLKEGNITFNGAIDNEVSGSNLIYTTIIDGKKYTIGVDAGKSYHKDIKSPTCIPDIIIATHGHLDHIGELPKLCNQGFKGTIFGSDVTKQITRIALQDNFYIDTQRRKRDTKKEHKNIKQQLYESLDYINTHKITKKTPNNTNAYTTENNGDINNLGDKEYKKYKNILDKYKITTKKSIEKLTLPTHKRPYTEKDVNKVHKLFRAVGLNKKTLIKKGKDNRIRMTLIPAGHIGGSVMVLIEDELLGTTVFTGDVGRIKQPLYTNPPLIKELPKNIDRLVTETTYGSRIHPDRHAELTGMRNAIQENKGNTLVLVFALDRLQMITQSILENYDNFFANKRLILDGFSAKKYTRIYQNLTYFSQLRNNKNITRAPKNIEQRQKRLKQDNNIIISPPGMANGGTAGKYLDAMLLDPNALVILTGYQSKGSKGRQISEGTYKIGKEQQNIQCKILHLTGQSSHADQQELLAISLHTRPQTIFLNHGEETSKNIFRALLQEKGFNDIRIPSSKQNSYTLYPKNCIRINPLTP